MGITWRSLVFGELAQNLIYLFGRELLVIGLVHLHHRRRSARRQTFRGAQREAPVGGGLPHPDSQALLTVREDGVAAAQRSGEGPAHPDLILARGMLVEQGVERDHAL